MIASHLEVPELPCEVKYLYERERHGDEAEHEVGDGQVDDEDVPGRAHGRVPGHHVDDHEVAHRSDHDHHGVQGD